LPCVPKSSGSSSTCKPCKKSQSTELRKLSRDALKRAGLGWFGVPPADGPAYKTRDRCLDNIESHGTRPAHKPLGWCTPSRAAVFILRWSGGVEEQREKSSGFGSVHRCFYQKRIFDLISWSTGQNHLI
jgi:hypothetical protein